MRYRIKISVMQDGSKIYTPQYKEGLFWSNYLMGTLCEDVVTFPNESLAEAYIDDKILNNISVTVSSIFYKEYPR